MNQGTFEKQHRALWHAFDQALVAMEGRGKGRRIGKKRREQAAEDASLSVEQFPHAYRQLCQHLSLARERQYSPRLVGELDRLVTRGHQQLYSSRAGSWGHIIDFFARDFPRLVRKEWRLVLVALVLFYGPALIMGGALKLAPEMVYTVIEPQQLAEIESMYDPSNNVIGRERDSDTDFYMFGFYIRNNIGISFQVFAGGILLGLGTLFYLFYNGLYLGTVTAHLANIGYGQTFFPFVIGHGAFELTAIVLSAVAGLRLGLALLKAGRLRRGDALREVAGHCVRIVYGVVAMLLVAAFLEAFWSSSTTVPVEVKYTVGAVFWSLVLLYFLFAGRRHEG